MKRARSLTKSIENSDSNFEQSNSSFPSKSKVDRRDVLRNVVVCVTGLPPGRKAKLHRTVERLGGRFTRDLVIEHTTHLIAEVDDGPKYTEAARNKHITIVKPSWLESCAMRNERIPEKHHLLMFADDDDDGGFSHPLPQDARPARSTDRDHAFTERNNKTPLHEACNEIIMSSPPNSLFMNCSFFFVGYGKFDSSEGPPGEGIIPDSSLECHENRSKFALLARHGMGTIYWNLTEDITHVIVNESCDLDTFNAAKYIVEYHPNHPAFLSSRWLLESQKHHLLQPVNKFFPFRVTKKAASRNNPRFSRKEPKVQKESSTFQGMIFSIFNHSNPDEIFDVSTSELERIIVSNDGVILNKKVFDVLMNEDDTATFRRTLCIVFPGMLVPDYAQKIDFLPDIEKANICTILPVNINYVLTCAELKLDFAPDCDPVLFEPQPFSIKILNPPAVKSPLKLIVSVTGFIGHYRSGIARMLKAIGAEYTENLSQKNTHLICKKAEGAKFLRGLEWKLHLVGIEWLYHILKYGYKGKEDEEKGCEQMFRVQGKVQNDCSDGEEARKGPNCDSRKCDENTKLENKANQASDNGFLSNSFVDSTVIQEHDERIKSSLQTIQQPLNFGLSTKKRSGTLLAKKRTRRRRTYPAVKKSSDLVEENTKADSSSDEEQTIEKTNISSGEKKSPAKKIVNEEDDLLGTFAESQAVWYG